MTKLESKVMNGLKLSLLISFQGPLITLFHLELGLLIPAELGLEPILARGQQLCMKGHQALKFAISFQF